MSAVLVESASTALFVPGHRVDRYEKAAASGAGFVIVDLEDAVSREQKNAARDTAFAAVSDPNSSFSAAVRINGLTDGGDADVAALARIDSSRGRLLAVVIPKCEDPTALSEISTQLPGIPLVPLIETAHGLARADALASVPGVARLAFGAIDFGVDVDATGSTMLDFARCQIVIASRRAGLAAPLDSPNPEFRDLEVVRHSATSGRSLGFGGQLCIHPIQVAIVRAAFAPNARDIDWARRVVALGDGSAGQVDGSMVDRPVYLRALSVLRRAEAPAD